VVKLVVKQLDSKDRKGHFAVSWSRCLGT